MPVNYLSLDSKDLRGRMITGNQQSVISKQQAAGRRQQAMRSGGALFGVGGE